MRFLVKILTFCIIIYSCEKIYYYPDRYIGEPDTKFLAHRGSGITGYEENTLAGSIIGFENYDGIEIDIQISKDGTLWLSHDAELPDCGSITTDCFIETPDYFIDSLDMCFGNQRTFTRLEEVFSYMTENYPDKYISLDVKAWNSCNYIESNILNQLNFIGDAIIFLVDKYQLQGHVMVECETATFLRHVKKHSNGIDCYLTTFGDFERGMLIALEKGFHGISFEYKFDEEITIDHVRMIRKKGLRIQLWTVEEIYLNEAISIQPDFIQLDNIDSELLPDSLMND